MDRVYTASKSKKQFAVAAAIPMLAVSIILLYLSFKKEMGLVDRLILVGQNLFLPALASFILLETFKSKVCISAERIQLRTTFKQRELLLSEIADCYIRKRPFSSDMPYEELVIVSNLPSKKNITMNTNFHLSFQDLHQIYYWLKHRLGEAES